MTHVSKSARSNTPRFPIATASLLRCPLCGAALDSTARSIRCSQGHNFDVAKQGYVNLLHAGVSSDTADTADMARARAEFLADGHYAFLADALARSVKERSTPKVIVDAGAGTGYYLSRLLVEFPESVGVAFDVSAFSLRRAAKAHPRLGAAVWNVWEPWPIVSHSADVILNVFAPRNIAEFSRVLADDGLLVVVSPQNHHLTELSTVADILAIEPDKEQRLDAKLSESFTLIHRTNHEQTLALDADDIERLLAMGPNAHHTRRDDIEKRLAAVDTPLSTTAAFVISLYRKNIERTQPNGT